MLQIFKKSLILGLSICLIIPVAEAKGAKGKVVSSILSGSKNKLTLLSNQDLAKKEQRLNKKQREGKNFTSLGKQIVREKNVRQNNGVLLCNNCGIKTVLAKKHTKGNTPPSNESHVDHIKAKSKGGSGTPDNGQNLCRKCNLKKGNN